MNAVDSVPLDDEAVTNAFTDFDVIDMRVQNDLSIRIDEDAVTSVEQVNTVYNRDRSDGDQIVLNPAMAGMIAAMAYAGRIYEDGDLVPLRAVDPTGTYWFVVRAQFNASLRDPDGERNYRSVPESVAAELISDVDYERLGLDETLGPRNSGTPAVPSASSHQEEPVSAEDPPDRPGEPIAPPSVSPLSAQESVWNDGRSDPASVSSASSPVVDDSPGGSWGGWSVSQDESSTVPVPVAPAGGSGGSGAWSVPVSEDPRSPARFQSSQSDQSVWSAPSAQSAPAGPVSDGREPVVPWGSDSAVSGPEVGVGSEDVVPTAPVSVRPVSDQGGAVVQAPAYGWTEPVHAPAKPLERNASETDEESTGLIPVVNHAEPGPDASKADPSVPPSIQPSQSSARPSSEDRPDREGTTPASVSSASSPVVDDSPGGSWGGWSVSQDESSTVPVPVAPAGGSGGSGAWSVPVSEDPRSPARFQSSQSDQSVWSAPSAQSAPAGPVSDGREPVVPWGSDSAVSGPEVGVGSEDVVPTAPVSVRPVSDQGGAVVQAPAYGVNGPSHAQVPAQPFAHPPSQGSGGNPFPPPETRQETTQGRPPSTPQGYWPQPVPAAQWDNIPVQAQGPGGAQETPPLQEDGNQLHPFTGAGAGWGSGDPAAHSTPQATVPPGPVFPAVPGSLPTGQERKGDILPNVSGQGKSESSSGKSRISRRAVLYTGGTAAGLVVAAVAARALQRRLSSSPTPSASSTTGQATQGPRPKGGSVSLPAKTSPEPLSEKAVWTQGIKESTSPLAVSSGVLVLTPDSKMAAIGEDGATASSIDVPGNAQALILGTWSGNPAVWVDCQDKILCIPLTGLSLGSPTSVDVLAGSTVTWVGGSPLMTLSSAQAAGVDAQGSYTVDVPSGYVATTADDKGLLMLDGAGHWKLVSRSGPLSEGLVSGPKDASLTLIRTLTTSQVLLGWSNRSVTVFDIAGKETKASIDSVDASAMSGEGLNEFAGTGIWALSTLVINTEKSTISKAQFPPITYDRAYLYGHVENGEAWVYTTMAAVSGNPLPIASNSPAIPWGGSDALSYAVDTSDSGWAVYALKH